MKESGKSFTLPIVCAILMVACFGLSFVLREISMLLKGIACVFLLLSVIQAVVYFKSKKDEQVAIGE